MYNVIFYDKTKVVPESRTTPRYVFDYTTGNDTYTTAAYTVDVTYRTPSKFVFNTATSCDGMFAGDSSLDEFAGDMPSLNSANEMFAAAAITSFKGATGGIAQFQSVTDAEEMFSDCEKLVTVDADFSSLLRAADMFKGCTALTSVSGSFNSL